MKKKKKKQKKVTNASVIGDLVNSDAYWSEQYQLIPIARYWYNWKITTNWDSLKKCSYEGKCTILMHIWGHTYC